MLVDRALEAEQDQACVQAEWCNKAKSGMKEERTEGSSTKQLLKGRVAALHRARKELDKNLL